MIMALSCIASGSNLVGPSPWAFEICLLCCDAALSVMCIETEYIIASLFMYSDQ